VPLYPPPPLEGRYHCSEYGDFIFTVARLDALKRVDWLIRAMAFTKTPVRCLIAGTGPESDNLAALIQELGVESRVRLLSRIGDEALLDHFARCLAVYYAPYDEDYGYVTVEAFKSQKPVLTAGDSGGVLEFVQDQEMGFVLPPNQARRLAARLDQLYEDRALAQTQGLAGSARVASITWDNVINNLLKSLD
jgi:glycosyltransferase involved in cell wall biosynthesis